MAENEEKRYRRVRAIVDAARANETLEPSRSVGGVQVKLDAHGKPLSRGAASCLGGEFEPTINGAGGERRHGIRIRSDDRPD